MDSFVYKQASDADLRHVIYLLRCDVSGKVYIGQTTQRLADRLRGYPKQTHKGIVCRAVRKYGKAAFTVEVLDVCESLTELDAREKYWIGRYKSTDPKRGYNIQFGGGNSPVSEATKAKLSIRCSGWNHTDLAKRKISVRMSGRNNPHYGERLSARARAKLSAAHMGHRHTIETRRKMSATRRGRPITWGAKIARAKTKVTYNQLVEAIRVNPAVSRIDLAASFGVTANVVACQGGIKALRVAAGI